MEKTDSLRKRIAHPYIGATPETSREQSARAVETLNEGRQNSRGPAVEVTYWFEVTHDGAAFEGIMNAAKMVLDHGTLKPWHQEGDAAVRKPSDYDEFMSWATDICMLAHDAKEGVETGLATIAYPLKFFDKRSDGAVPLAQLLMAAASEPSTAFSFYQGARMVDMQFPAELLSRFPKRRWPHARVRSYLGIGPKEPIIGTIVKPKTGLTPELFSRSVVEAATAGALFTKADENMHLTLADVPRYVGRVVKDLEAAGFDLGRADRPGKKRFLFAPHITTDADCMRDYARAAVEAGANALMFSPYYGGGFPLMARIIEELDVPVYAHTAGMNVTTGSLTWGLDPRITYSLASLYGAAFMQLTTTRGYLKPDDTEKDAILAALDRHALAGSSGMTLAIAGGLGPANIGMNARRLGMEGRMFLAGSSVYGHPDGPGAGVRAIITAFEAYMQEGITDTPRLKEYAVSRGAEGRPLLRALPAG